MERSSEDETESRDMSGDGRSAGRRTKHGAWTSLEGDERGRDGRGQR